MIPGPQLLIEVAAWLRARHKPRQPYGRFMLPGERHVWERAEVRARKMLAEADAASERKWTEEDR